MTKNQLLRKPYIRLTDILEITGLTRYSVKKVLGDNKDKIYRINAKYYRTADICKIFRMSEERKRAFKEETE